MITPKQDRRKNNRRKTDRRKSDRRNSSNNDSKDKIDWMNKSCFFDSFSPEDKSAFLQSSPCFMKFKHGDLIIRQNSTDRSVYIILLGSAKVIKKSGKSELVIGLLKAGDTFGEISLLRKGGRTFDVKAEELTVAISITGKQIDSLPINLQSKMKSQFLNIMLDRFERVNKKYTELLGNSSH